MLEHCDTLIVPTSKILMSSGVPVKESSVYKTLEELAIGSPFKETPLYKKYVSYIESSTHPTRIHGIASEFDINKRLEDLCALFSEIKLYKFRHIPLIELYIDDHGNFITWEGNNRLSICCFLGLQEILAKIVGRSGRWVNFKRQLYDEYEKGALYNPINHPDFCNWTIINHSVRWGWISKSIEEELSLKVDLKSPCTDDFSYNGLMRKSNNIFHRRILDLGCHYGYFSHNLADLNYEVTGVDQNAMYIKGAQYLNLYYKHFVNFIKDDIFNFVNYADKTEQIYDTVLLLNVLYHLMKDNDATIILLTKIGRMSPILFTDYDPAAMNLDLPEFVKFVCSTTGYNVYTQLGYNNANGRTVLMFKRE